MAKLTETAHFVDELLNRNPDPRAAVGRAQRLRPQGRPARRGHPRRRVDLRALRPGARRQRARAAGLRAGGQAHRAGEGGRRSGWRWTTPAAARVIERVKELEHRGYQFEAADGSFELLLRQEAGEYEPLFRLESWRVIVEQRADGKVETEATIKVWLDGERYVTTAEGNGPVNALDAALRAAIVQVHPHLADVELVNFKVRILDETHGTDAVTRVVHRLLRRHRRLGLDGRARERHRRLVAGAGGLAGVRRAGRAPARGERAAARCGRRERDRARRHPDRAAGHRQRGGAGGPGGAALGAPLARAARAGVRGGASRRSSARAHASAVSAGTPRCTWRCAPSA